MAMLIISTRISGAKNERLCRKNVLVLGGSRGIGAAIVRRFASGGARAAFTYLGSSDAALGARQGNWFGSAQVSIAPTDRR